MGQETKPLILLGGGGHARSTLDIIGVGDGSSISGILDDSLEVGQSVAGIPVLGPTSRLPEFVNSHDFVVALGKIGQSTRRQELAERCWAEGGHLRTLISDKAYVSPHAEIGEGSAVFHGAIVNAGATVGRNCIINSLALIEHDSHVGDHSHISTGALVNGSCTIGRNVFLGSGSVLHHRVTLADGAVIHAGEIVKADNGNGRRAIGT